MRRVREFQSILVENGYSVTVRTTRGNDIELLVVNWLAAWLSKLVNLGTERSS